MNLAVVLGFGVLLGMQHATEADHLAAVASLASNARSIKHGIFHGIAWGLGHTAMLLLVTGVLALLGWAISPLMAANMERIVGAMLIVLGVGVLLRLRRSRVHFHAHTHADAAVHANVLTGGADALTHFHAHSHAGEAGPHSASAHRHAHRLPLRSVFVGMIHGMAGSAALALLASQSMPTPGWMFVYIAVFGAGSIAGMALLSGMVAIPLRLTARHLTRVYGMLNLAVALFSIALGGRLLAGFGG